MHEAQVHQENSFITLTYDDEHLPPYRSLRYRDFQLFMKRLRRRAPKGREISFYMCGEYGENFARPHFHACLFNYDFADKRYLRTTGSKSKLYTSEILSSLWKLGFSSLGDVNFESAAYVARYVMKKITGDDAAMHYGVVDEATGELIARKPEFNHMSLKPAIGKRWLDKYWSDVYPRAEVVVRGKICKPPKYYDKKFFKSGDIRADAVEYDRYKFGQDHAADNTEERLRVKEIVTRARISQLKRTI